MILAGCNGGTLESARRKPLRPTSDPEVEIFMRVAATDDEIAGVQRALRQSGNVTRYQLVSQQDAYREFKRLFKGQPDLIATTSPESLPASVRVTLVEGAPLARFANAFGKLPGVDEVKYTNPRNDVSKFIKNFCRDDAHSRARALADVRQVDALCG